MMSSPEVAGLLYKKRGGFGKMMLNAWQYRFVVITKEGYLLYFDTENADADFDISKARGRLDLKSIQYDYSIDAIEGAPTNYSIQIGIPNEEKWKLCADTKEIQAKWCKVLDKFMNEKNFSKSVKTSPNMNIPAEDDTGDRSRRAAPSSPTNTPSTAPLISDGETASTSNENKPTVTVDVSQVKSVEVAPTIAVTPSTVPSSSPTEPTPINNVTTKAVPVVNASKFSHHSKKRLKLAAKKSMIEQEWVEWSLALLVVNICILGICTSNSFFRKIIYFCACNYVVGFTLNLRFMRAVKNVNTVSTTQGLHSEENVQQVTAVNQQNSSVGKTPPDVAEVALNEEKWPQELQQESVVMDIISGQKPVAGCTYVQSLIDPKLSPPHTWSRADHRQFSVRVGPDYNRYKKKAASGAPIYEPFAVDMFCAKQRVDHAATRFQLPDTSDINTNNPHVPPIFVVQIQIPSEPPTSFFSSSEDGPGWAVVMYFKITEDACNQLKDIANASPAVKLFAEWCEKAPTDPAWRGRFKVINSCTNMEELGFPSMIVSYNAKPVLIRRTGTIFRGSNYMEMDIHVHKFANVAKQSIYLISSRCGVMFMQIGFVIEGRDDKELPETLFGCVAVNRPQEDQAEFIFDD